MQSLSLKSSSSFNPRLREGGDSSHIPLLVRLLQVSIHASAREATISQLRSSHITKRFQSTPPRGRRPVLILALSISHTVSIHASAREATTRPSCARFPSKRFNPRLREGGDQKGRQEKPYERGFNPRLREGGDAIR